MLALLGQLGTQVLPNLVKQSIPALVNWGANKLREKVDNQTLNRIGRSLIDKPPAYIKRQVPTRWHDPYKKIGVRAYRQQPLQIVQQQEQYQAPMPTQRRVGGIRRRPMQDEQSIYRQRSRQKYQ